MSGKRRVGRRLDLAWGSPFERTNSMSDSKFGSLIESHEGWEVCGEAEDGDEAVPEATLVSDIRGNRARTKS